MGRVRLALSLLLAVWCSAFAARADAAEPLHPCITRIEDPVEPVARLADKVTHYSCHGRQSAHGAGNFLVRMTTPPARSTAADPLVLRISSVWQERAQILFRYADGATRTLAYSAGTTGDYMTIGALPQFTVPVHDAPLSAIFTATEGSANLRGVVLGAQLLHKSESDRQQHWLMVLYAAFLGLSLALLGYNFALWMALRQPFQLSYCAMVAGLLFYAFLSSGAVMLLIEGLNNNDRLRLNYIVQSLASVAACDFIFRFFGRKVTGARLDRIRILLSGGIVASAIGYALFAPWHIGLFDRLYYLFSILTLAAALVALFRAWQARTPLLWLFVLAWIAPITVGFARLLNGFGVLPFSFWLDNGNTIALSFEALISIPIIVTRLRTLMSERDGAIAAQRSAIALASSDPLTGLLNRRAFLEQAIGREGVHRLFLLDIDHFKQVNDRHGHAAGDDVLCELAAILDRHCRPEFLAARLGGEEFAILMPMSATRVGDAAALLQAIRAHAMPSGITVTASLGVADGKVENETQWLALYREADAALYHAKSSGRDRACQAGHMPVMAA